MAISKYDFGLTWVPVTNALIGLKHESLRKDRFEIGKVKLYIHNYATLNQTIGTEFALDWQKRILEARLGLHHKFDNQTSAKLKIDHHGFVDALLKHNISHSVAVSVSSRINIKSEVLEEPRSRSLPFGISFDINF